MKLKDQIRKYWERFKQSAFIEKCKHIVLPGFDGMPFYEIAVFFKEGLKKGYISTRASSLSFKFFLALFPAIIFLFTLIPFIPIPNFQEELLNILVEVLPSNVYEVTEATLKDLITNPRGGLLSFGFLFALFFAINGIDAMFHAFNESVHIESKASWGRRKLNALLVLLIIMLLIIVAIGLLIGSQFVITDFLENRDTVSAFFVQLGKWLIIISLYFFNFSFIYYLGSHKSHRWRFISAGSTLATLLSLFLSLGFSYYVNNFGQYNKLYGSLGTLIVVLVWIYVNSMVLLIGFELNISIHRAQRSRSA